MSTSTAATITVLQAAGAAGVPVLLWGEPGVGKSALVESLATARGVPCEVVVGSTREPADFLGLPVVAGDGSVHMAPPDWFVRLRDAGCGVLFLDELSCAPPAVQAAMLRVARERYVGAERLPEGVSVVAAANPPEQAADGWDLPAPMANRFCHLDYNPALADWLSGMTVGFDSLVEVAPAVASPTKARQAGMRAQVAAFIRRRPDLAQCCPTDPAQAGRAWASRRTWTYLADVLAALPDHDEEAAMLAACGLVGDGPATEFLVWRREADLPDPDAVLADPASVDWSDRTDRIFAILAGVVARVAVLGTTSAWRAGWAVVGAAAGAGVGDVGAVAVIDLMRCRPPKAAIPAAARAFAGILTEAGLIGEAVAA